MRIQFLLSKIATKTGYFLEKKKALDLTDFDQSQNSNLNASLKSPFQELLNAYFSFEFE